MKLGGGVVSCKWHVSPYYVMCELPRLIAGWRFPIARSLVAQAADYLLQTQRDDGGWGKEHSTHEETSFAALGIEAVRRVGMIDEATCMQALRRAGDFLVDKPLEYEKLWIGKSLYCVRPLTKMIYEVALHKIKRLIRFYDI